MKQVAFGVVAAFVAVGSIAWLVWSSGASQAQSPIKEGVEATSSKSPAGSSSTLFDAPVRGLCDASGAVWFDDALWVVEDERNHLFRYSANDEPRKISLKSLLGKGEADLEAGALLGSTAFWIGSHDRGKSGKEKPARQVLFSVDLTSPDQPTGFLVRDLLGKLAANAELASLIDKSVGIGSKEPGGLSIEGLAVDARSLLTPGDGPGLLVGFRAPLSLGKSLLVPLGIEGGDVIVGEPIWLPLQGGGIRSLAGTGPWVGVSGPAGSGAGHFRLFTYDGSEVTMGDEVADKSLKPEALFAIDGGFKALSDDGSRSINGSDCKDLPSAARQARWVEVQAP